MLQHLFIAIFIIVSIPLVKALMLSRFSSPIADYLCLASILTSALLPGSQYGVLRKTGPFFEEYSGILFAVATLGTWLLLLIAGLVRIDKQGSESPTKLTWVSLLLSLSLVIGLFVLLVAVGFGDGA